MNNNDEWHWHRQHQQPTPNSLQTHTNIKKNRIEKKNDKNEGLNRLKDYKKRSMNRQCLPPQKSLKIISIQYSYRYCCIHFLSVVCHAFLNLNEP